MKCYRNVYFSSSLFGLHRCRPILAAIFGHPDGNFMNVLSTATYARGAQKRKRDSEVVNLFTLSGITRLKAVRRTLMKLSPDGCLVKVIKWQSL